MSSEEPNAIGSNEETILPVSSEIQIGVSEAIQIAADAVGTIYSNDESTTRSISAFNAVQFIVGKSII